jgi:hypothetical protein
MHGVHSRHARRLVDGIARGLHDGDMKLTIASSFVLACLSSVAFTEPSMLASQKDAKWIPLDAKAGAKGPQISISFGEMGKKAPIGFLLKTPPGFHPGPHTHSSDDWAVVIAGKMHNYPAGKDAGKALIAGDRWHQVADEPHDNLCEPGAECLMFVYMPDGFDFKPVAK